MTAQFSQIGAVSKPWTLLFYPSPRRGTWKTCFAASLMEFLFLTARFRLLKWVDNWRYFYNGLAWKGIIALCSALFMFMFPSLNLWHTTSFPETVARIPWNGALDRICLQSAPFVSVSRVWSTLARQILNKLWKDRTGNSCDSRVQELSLKSVYANLPDWLKGVHTWYTPVYLFIHIYIYICTYIYIYTHVHTYTHIYIYTHYIHWHDRQIHQHSNIPYVFSPFDSDASFFISLSFILPLMLSFFSLQCCCLFMKPLSNLSHLPRLSPLIRHQTLHFSGT